MKTDPPQPSAQPHPHTSGDSRPAAPRKVFDVMRPGRALASSTSRPVIVGHKPQVRDPSVTVNGVGESRQLMNARQKIQITPVQEDSHTRLSVSESAAVQPPSAPAGSAPSESAPASAVATPAPSGPMFQSHSATAAPQTPAVSPSGTPPIPTATPQSSPAPTAEHKAELWALEPPKSATETAAEPAAQAGPITANAAAPQSSSYDSGEVPAGNVAHLPSVSPPPALSPTNTASHDALLDTMPTPDIEDQQVDVSPHIPSHHSVWKIITPLVILLVFALVIVDVLLDAGFFDLGVPHTHFF